MPEGNRQALRMLAEKIIDPDRLITHRFALDDNHARFDIVEQRKGIKVVINP